AKQEFFRPGSEEQNGDGGERERFPFTPARRKRNKVQSLAEEDGNAREDGKAGENEEAPVTSPADRVAGAINAAQQQEGREGDVDYQKRREHVSELGFRIRP